MNKNTQNKNRKMSKLSSYLKVSCSALILSSSLVGYGFTKDAFAATQDAETATSETTTHVQKDLQDAMNKAKKDIKQLKHLSAVELKSYKEDIESAKNQNEIKNIIKEAKKENKQQHKKTQRTFQTEIIALNHLALKMRQQKKKLQQVTTLLLMIHLIYQMI